MLNSSDLSCADKKMHAEASEDGGPGRFGPTPLPFPPSIPLLHRPHVLPETHEEELAEVV